MGRSRLLKPLPWYPWSPVQWQASRKVQRMSWAERGLYRELMDECWQKGSVPSTAEGIADLFEMDPEEVAPLLPAVLRCFDVQDDGTMTSPYIEDIRTEQDAYRIGQKEKALEREERKRREAEERRQQEAAAVSTPDQQDAASCAKEQLDAVVKERKGKERKENTPLPPKGGKPRGRGGVVVEEFHPAVQEISKRLAGIWPKTQPDGDKINPDGPMLRARLHHLITQAKIRPDLLTRAAEIYLAHPKKRYRAPQFFFGPGGNGDTDNPWMPYVQQAMSQPTPPQPPPLPLEEPACPTE